LRLSTVSGLPSGLALCISQSKRAGRNLAERLFDKRFLASASFNVAKDVEHAVFATT